MAKQRRIYEIAKELGVDSKAIVAKCRAEGVPGIDTHMSPVKMGLEMTIREWFSTTHEHVTAVETAAPVDIEKAKKSRRRRASDKSHAAADGGAGGSTVTVATTTIEEPPKTVPVEEPGESLETRTTEESKTSAAVAPPSVEAAPQVLATPAADQSAAAKASPVAPTEPLPTVAKKADHSHKHKTTEPPAVDPAAGLKPAARAPHAPKKASEPIKPMGVPNVPDRPLFVSPAGPRLNQPQQVQLRGPKVVRIEQPDVIRAPKPRRGPGGGGPGGGGSGGDALPGVLRSRGPVRGKGVGTGGGDEEGEGQAKAGNKRRSLTTRRGRFADAQITGPTKFTDADLAELDAKLRGAPGYVKQRRRDLKKPGQAGALATPAEVGGKVEISEPITIKNLSSVTGIKSSDIIKYIFAKGLMATINSSINAEMAMEVALEYDIDLVVKEQKTLEQALIAQFDDRQATDVRRRPPVVTIMGHVDHGKTSLLDRIRKTDVAAHEAGGITQHIGAYRVTIAGNDNKPRTVVFLDTPGHEAFTSLRARGASITDIVVLVVAADDGIMPQTVESIAHAQAAKVPIIVALNKIDKPEATESNIRRIYGQLAEKGLNPTEWGGQTEVIKVSATSGTGVTDLVEILDYQAELLDLKADYGGPARGTVIEALMAPGRGPVARVLVQQGTLKVGDTMVVGRAFGRVRDMTDDRNKAITEAGPATPVELSGMDLLCNAGDVCYVTNSLQKAEEIATQFREADRLRQLANQTKVTLENFAQKMEEANAKELRVVLKCDVQGSLDVLRKSLTDLSTTEVGVKVLHAAVGGITESDVLLADASDAVVIGFNVVAPAMIRDVAEQRHVEIRPYRIIYEITEDVKKALEGMLEPETREEILGTAEVREVFKVSKVGSVAGCIVLDGNITRSARLRVARENIVVTDNREVDSLRRFKEDAKEVRAGMECGIKVLNFDDVKPGDKIICYQTITVKRKLGA